MCFSGDSVLARSLLASAVARDSFPWLPRPHGRVLLAVAPDARRFRAWTGPGAPEWGAAIAFPEEGRIVMQGHRAGSDAGDPVRVFRHELAHLALHEALGDLPPRWFDEGYASVAAGEWGRGEVLTTSLALVAHGVPPLDSLDNGFEHGAASADAAYALAYRAVSELAAQDPARGLTLFFVYWRETRSMDAAVRKAFGMTLASFDRRFHDQTLKRYGSLAIVTNLTFGAGMIALLILPAYVVRRRRQRRRLAELRAADEAAERVERESVIAALLQSAPPAE